MGKNKSYVIIDEETTIKNKKIGNNKAFPFYAGNKIVLHGAKVISQEDPEGTVFQARFPEFSPSDADIEQNLSLMVGHNLKFDIHYLMKEGTYIGLIPIREWLAKNHIWDTQQAEYILSGQSQLFPTLDYCSEKYGGTLKDDRIKEMWDADIQTEDIDSDMLAEYHEADLHNTDIVFIAQLERAKEEGKLPLIKAMNNALQGYQEMEYNGMAIHIPTCLFYHNREEIELLDISKQLLTYLHPSIRDHVNFSSPTQLSALLFGGELKYKMKEDTGYVYKSGKKKGENKVVTVEKSAINPLYKIKAPPEWKTKKKGVFKTSDDVFEDLLMSSYVSPKAKEFISLLQQYRKKSKEINTYYAPMPGLVCDDGLIHQNINNCQTGTGRLSESNPNLQNVSTGKESNVKSMFVSRWGKDGKILDADYKQLEVIALAFLSGDKQLRADIKMGIDMHERTHNKVRHLLNPALSDKEQRRQVKAVNFGLIYGGGATTLSKQSGLPVDVVKKIIKAFYSLYPEVRTWQDATIAKVEAKKYSGYGHTKGGYPRSMGKLKSLTGREYTFLEFDAPNWVKATKHIDTSFSPTQIKNYPVQGFATADIVPLVIGALYRRLLNEPRLKDNVLMINTVHDSIIFDVRQEYEEEAKEVIREVMESAPQMLKDVFGIEFDLPLHVDITTGPNWKAQKGEE